jgi:hypothetical protein
VQRLNAYIGSEDPTVADSVIERMLNSPVFETREAGGQLAALATMQWDTTNLLDFVLKGDDIAFRKGAAQVCAHRLSITSDAPSRGRRLNTFFDDPEEDVRKTAAEVAGALRGERLRPFSVTLAKLIESEKSSYSVPQLLIALEHAPDRVDDLLLQCSHRFIAVHRSDVTDIRTRAAGDAGHVGELLVRAYAQAESRTIRGQILDLSDKLLELGAYGLADVVGESER